LFWSVGGGAQDAAEIELWQHLETSFMPPGRITFLIGDLSAPLRPPTPFWTFASALPSASSLTSPTEQEDQHVYIIGVAIVVILIAGFWS
jgi:hypothetical protein